MRLRTALGELTAPPDSLAGFWGKEWGREGKGKKGEGKRGASGVPHRQIPGYAYVGVDL